MICNYFCIVLFNFVGVLVVGYFGKCSLGLVGLDDGVERRDVDGGFLGFNFFLF